MQDYKTLANEVTSCLRILRRNVKNVDEKDRQKIYREVLKMMTSEHFSNESSNISWDQLKGIVGKKSLEDEISSMEEDIALVSRMIKDCDIESFDTLLDYCIDEFIEVIKQDEPVYYRTMFEVVTQSPDYFMALIEKQGGHND